MKLQFPVHIYADCSLKLHQDLIPKLIYAEPKSHIQNRAHEKAGGARCKPSGGGVWNHSGRALSVEALWLAGLKGWVLVGFWLRGQIPRALLILAKSPVGLLLGCEQVRKSFQEL